MSNTISYLIDLLARGLPSVEVARLATVSESYVSQLRADSDFMRKVEEKRAVFLAEREKRSEAVQKIHDQYLEAEASVISTLKRDIGHMRPGERIKFLQVLSGKKEPAPQIAEGKVIGAVQTIQLQLNSAVAAQFVMNGQKEIVGMSNGQSFAPLSSQHLKEELQAIEEKKLEELPTQKVEKKTESQPQLNKSADILGLFSMQLPTDLMSVSK